MVRIPRDEWRETSQDERMTGSLEKAWSETFLYAAEFSPFYRELFHGMKAVPRIDELPLVDKQTL